MGRPLCQSLAQLAQSLRSKRRRRAARSSALLAACGRRALALGAPAHAQDSVPVPEPESAPAPAPDSPPAAAPDDAAPAPEPRLQFAGYGGYQFGGAAHASSIETEINESASFGATAAYRIGHGAFAEIAYSHQSTDISVRSPNLGTNVYNFDADYLTIGGMTQFTIPGTDLIRPIFAGSLGATHFKRRRPRLQLQRLVLPGDPRRRRGHSRQPELWLSPPGAPAHHVPDHGRRALLREPERMHDLVLGHRLVPG
jgi:hypothetical protein